MNVRPSCFRSRQFEQVRGGRPQDLWRHDNALALAHLQTTLRCHLQGQAWLQRVDAATT
eukprot:COSAG06_NODE_60631_length_270_cov_0.608187_1_plen_58_part_10